MGSSVHDVPPADPASEKVQQPTATAAAADSDAKSDRTAAVANVSRTSGEKNADDGAAAPAAAAAVDDDDNNPNHPHGIKLGLIITALCLAVFLVALDQTIIAPALGAITAEYRSVKDIGWCEY
jgi:hypothetical protein